MTHIFKTVWLIINLIASAALLLSGYGGHINPGTLPIGGIALMIFPVLLAGMLLIILIDIVVWRRLAFVPTFAVLICAPAIWSICPLNINSPKPADGGREISVMTYNVMAFNQPPENILYTGINPTLSTIIAGDADIVCLQESRAIFANAGWAPKEQFDTIVSRYPYISMKLSMAILSKYPIDTIPMPNSGDPTALFMCARADVDGTDVMVYNLHLQSIGLSPEDKQLYDNLTSKPTTHRIEDGRGLISKLSQAMKKRSEQAQMVRQAIDSIGGDHILVCGDFNDIEGCYAERLIAGKQLHSLYTSVGVGPVITYYVNRFYFNIDHILYGGLEPLDYKCLRVKASDHYAVTGKLSLPTNVQPKNHRP